MNADIAGQIKRREEHCTGRYLRGLMIQNGEHLVNLCESNILKAQVTFLKVNYPELYFILKVQIT